MTDDQELSRRLTDVARATDGVGHVFPAQSLVQVAADVVAAQLEIRDPGTMVDVHRGDGAVRITAEVAVDGARPATETVRAVGERIRSVVDAEPGPRPDTITVVVRLVEDTVGITAADVAADLV
ncbi:hypothetical protein [Curtobacterium herbarum]|uniref:Asp23/Gls24 family envelope stress response protein n=1 Tax=Curtobacterium herbarum TaxID=150122 RepID=A0ABP4K4X3_9MICO|nr:hypothetical protein [Curtobacterium herbarum]MBM7476773.1 hypothetical protein [Curtobacterium herbarum]MCS6545213.1 hypothetical protein [Curtobacterium herbarum]